jgi:hypothetical protein
MSDGSAAQVEVERCLFCGVLLRESQGKRGTVWVNDEVQPDKGARVVCMSALGFHQPSRGPKDGHLFRVSVTSRGVLGDGKGNYTECDWDGPPMVVEVRAWNLSDAVRRASFFPMNLWFASAYDPDEDREDTRLEEPHYGR